MPLLEWEDRTQAYLAWIKYVSIKTVFVIPIHFQTSWNKHDYIYNMRKSPEKRRPNSCLIYVNNQTAIIGGNRCGVGVEVMSVACGAAR